MKMLVTFLIVSVVIFSCKRDKGYLNNSTANEDALPTIHLDSASIGGLYKYIFSQSCASNGCHDGSFEPNYTSIQSTYQTLVYQPIIKNNAKKEYRYRVVPFDTSKSVLYQRITQRCFVNQNDFMPQLSDQQLERKYINLIGKWIMNGARDAEGNTPPEPKE